MANFIIRLHLTTTLWNSAFEEPEDEMSLNLLHSVLTWYLHSRIFKYVSLQKETYKLKTSRKKRNNIKFGRWTKNRFFKSQIYMYKT